MLSYYVQKADKILPIFDAKSLQDAKKLVAKEDHGRIVETAEKVFMNTSTGSVGFESDWDDLTEVTEVRYDVNEETWAEA